MPRERQPGLAFSAHAQVLEVRPALHSESSSRRTSIGCEHHGNVVEGTYPVNAAAFAIHSRVHQTRSDAVAAAHSHSTYGRAWSTLGRPLDPITQDVCAFYQDRAIYDEFGGVAVELDEGQRIANALGPHKAAILQNHGLLTVGKTVDETAWWFITMERS